jgi:excisionase family DNA binding protein
MHGVTELRAIEGGGKGSTPERFVDRKEMAAILGVSLRTLDRMIAERRVPSVTWGTRTRRFRPSAVVHALSQEALREAA